MKQKSWIPILGMLAVGLGAFGAHGLKNIVGIYELQIWDKAVHYMFWHVLLLLVMMLSEKLFHISLTKAIIATTAGIILFSGSLYLLALKSFHPIPTIVLGPLTPIGGILLIVGWFLLFYTLYKKEN